MVEFCYLANGMEMLILQTYPDMMHVFPQIVTVLFASYFLLSATNFTCLYSSLLVLYIFSTATNGRKT